MHPVKMMMESKLEVHKDKTLREATEMAYKVGWFTICLHNQFFQQHNKSVEYKQVFDWYVLYLR